MGNRKQDSVSIAKHTKQKNTFPKLKGGGKKPKSLLTDDKEVELELTFLRSLDLLTEGSDHNKCELAKINAKESLCNFCLLRSLVIRSRNPKGRTKIKPIEFLCIENTNIEHIYQCIKDASPKLSDKIITDWGCESCSIVDEDIYMNFSQEKYEGKDLYTLIRCWEITYNRRHAGHENKNHKEGEVLFFKCDYGVSINLTSTLKFLGKDWICKSIITEDHSYFYSDEKYYVVENGEVEIWNDRHLTGVMFTAFEVTEQKQEDLDIANRGSRK